MFLRLRHHSVHNKVRKTVTRSIRGWHLQPISIVQWLICFTRISYCPEGLTAALRWSAGKED